MFSTSGRQKAATAEGAAKAASRSSAGCTQANREKVKARRSSHASVVNNDMYMWSSTNTWLRSIDRRSRYSGRSWWAIETMVACRRATCASSAIVTLSRKRRCTRVLTVPRNQFAAALSAIPSAAAIASRVCCWITAAPSRASQTAVSAAGRAASCDSTSESAISPRSDLKPSLHSRHIEESVGGSGSMASGAGSRSGEGFIGLSLLVRFLEALRLQIEHRAVAAAERHQLIV